MNSFTRARIGSGKGLDAIERKNGGWRALSVGPFQGRA